jgi:flagellar biosynthesis protein FlhA
MPKFNRASLLVPLGVVLIVVMLVIPLPTSVLDIAITLNITFAMIVLTVALRVKDPLEFSAFPSVLLLATMFRLALNVSATRLVLLHGYAGSVISSFGHFVVGGSVIVGLVVFLILFIIQFVVITNGAGRLAVVGARFTLDAMPGKQMAIDADLNAGHIDEAEARRRREHIAREADFYGAMDGASKFVKGDAVAAVVITLINLLGGFIVGVLQNHLPITQAIDTYSLLSVGDGLVSQIPALLMSLSTGLVVTRTSNQADFGLDLLSQLGKQGKALELGGGVVAFLGLLPGLPKLPFILVGLGMFALGRRVSLGQARDDEQGITLPTDISAVQTSQDPAVSDSAIEAIELDLALDLLDIVDPLAGGDLLERIKGLRKKLATELGITLPPVRTRDNISLPQGTYVIKIYEVEVARGSAPQGRVLAIGDNLASLPGEATVEPVFQIPAKWIPLSAKAQATAIGATVVDRVSVLITHLAEVVRTHAAELVTRQQVKELLDELKKSAPVVVDEMAQSQIGLGEVQRVIKDLLQEGVSIRNLAAILESVIDRSKVSRDPDQLLDAARAGLGYQLALPYIVNNSLATIEIDGQSEHYLYGFIHINEGRSVLVLSPEEAAALVRQIEEFNENAARQGFDAVVVVSFRIRTPLRRLLDSYGCHVPVLADRDVSSTVRVVRVGVVRVDATAKV